MKPESFENYSRASKLRQLKIPPAIRSQRMRAAALAKWKNISPADRRKHALLMVEGKLWKNKKN
jgi:hypothetical protein